jgi:hypothetical protein
LGYDSSFLDYAGVAVFAGAFETLRHDPISTSVMVCDHRDLDRRKREFRTLLDWRRPFVFLVPSVPKILDSRCVPDSVDLFRTTVAELDVEWHLLPSSLSHLEIRAEEFKSYIEEHGSAHVVFDVSKLKKDDIKLICGAFPGYVFGFCIRDNLFFLPCHVPSSRQQAIRMVKSALKSVLLWQKRVSKELPPWVGEFIMSKEADLKVEEEKQKESLLEVQVKLKAYSGLKGLLCFHSDPLAELTVSILRERFSMNLEGSR